jgi:hypothetical protein
LIPPWPEGEPRAHAPIGIRYEDISQDGRLLLEVAPHGLGDAVWRHLMPTHPLSASLKQHGIVPILTRLCVEGGEGPHSVAGGMEASGTLQLAHSVDEAGVVDRVFLNMWCDLSAPVGRTYGPRADANAEKKVAARVFAEHVMTRLFAPAGQRRVVEIPPPYTPAVPPVRYESRSYEKVIEIPEDAKALDQGFVADAAPLAFGLIHTDSNQHVNSLVYLRIFEEAVLRRLHAHGKGRGVLSRRLEIAYRKPCFAGDVVRVGVRAYEREGKVGAVAVLVPEGPDALAGARPNAYVRMELW